MRLGPYIEGNLNRQTATEKILARLYQLRDIEEYKDVFIKKSMNEEDKNLKNWRKRQSRKIMKEQEEKTKKEQQGNEMAHKQQMLEIKGKEMNGSVT